MTNKQRELINIIKTNNIVALANILDQKELFTVPLIGISSFIHLAADKGMIVPLIMVLEKYPDLLDHKDENNQTALMWAAGKGHIGVVHYLLTLGADLNSKTATHHPLHNGKSALHWAFESMNKLVINCLIKAGAQVDDLLLSTQVFKDYLNFLLENENYPLLNILTKDKKILLLQFDQENYLLHAAAQRGRLELVRSILTDYPELLNQSSEHHITPLMKAASQGKTTVVNYLISQGADINLSIYCPGTLLHGATALS